MTTLPDKDFLVRSERLWKKRHTEAQAEVDKTSRAESHWYKHWRALREHRSADDPHRIAAYQDYAQARSERVAAEVIRDEASRWLKLRREQLAKHGPPPGSKPKIITAHQLGLSFTNRFGPLGPEEWLTQHHTAGPIDRSDSECARLIRQYHRDHANKGWGGIGYGVCIARSGTIFLLRPTALKGAHVGGHNSRNLGIMCHGTTGDRPTPEQVESLRWYLANAHTRAIPKRHRTDRDLRRAGRRGHNNWSGHGSNACPGTHASLVAVKA